MATQWLDQGQGAMEERKTMVEEVMQDCPLLAAAHNYMGRSILGSDGCRRNLVGRWLEGALQ